MFPLDIKHRIGTQRGNLEEEGEIFYLLPRYEIDINFLVILIQVYKKKSRNNAAGGYGVSETKLSETSVHPVVYTRG